MNYPTCDYCQKNNVYTGGDIDICTECLSKRDALSKTQAMEKYALNSKDLEHIPCVKKTNRHNKKTPICIYFDEDVKDKALEKYGTQEKLDERTQKRQKKRDKAKEIKNDRKGELEQFLKNKGVNIDEVKTNDLWLNLTPYIEQGESCGMTKETIYDILIVKEFYLKHTRYEEIFKNEFKKAQDADYKARNHPDEYRKIYHNHSQKIAFIDFIRKNKDRDAREWVDLIPPSLRDDET